MTRQTSWCNLKRGHANNTLRLLPFIIDKHKGNLCMLYTVTVDADNVVMLSFHLNGHLDENMDVCIVLVMVMLV